MKDTIFNIFFFLVIFSITAIFCLGTYSLYLYLVPGGSGLIFANPYAAALIPSLMSALFFAQYRAIHHPGRFTITYSLLAMTFFLLLSLPIPLIQNSPILRAPDINPLTPGRFLALDQEAVLLAPEKTLLTGQFGKNLVLIPHDQGPMKIEPQVQFDSFNQRFLFSADTLPIAVSQIGQERQYFQYPPLIQSFQEDLFAVYFTLKSTWETRPSVFWLQTISITFLFMGMFFFFSLKTWPLVQGIVVLLLMRFGLYFLKYCFLSLPVVVSQWVTGSWQTFLSMAAPLFLILLVATSLFFMTVLTKPHRKELVQ